MTGLFDSISQRFSHGSSPAITPRARVRFEPAPNEDGLIEEYTEHAAPPPHPPRATTPPPVDAPAFGRTPAPATTPPAETPIKGSTVLDPVSTEPVDQNDARAGLDTPVRFTPVPQAPNPPFQTVSEPKTTQKPLGNVAPDTSRADKPEPEPTPHPRTIERLTERQTKVTTRIAAPQPPAASPPDTPTAPNDGRAEVSATPPNVTVKIGRIEVSKPAPVSPPRAFASAKTQHSAPRSATSTLTNYLGWKS